MIEWLAKRGVEMIEQPMPRLLLDEAAWLRDRSPLPIMADEACQRLSDVRKLYGAYDGINIKLMKCTGMREARDDLCGQSYEYAFDDGLYDGNLLRYFCGCTVYKPA